MTEATIRANIKTTIENVSNTGLIYDYERWASTWDGFLSLFQDTDQIRGWTITCNGISQSSRSVGRRVSHKIYNYIIRGYFGLDDTNESEKRVLEIIENVLDALTDNLNVAVSYGLPTLGTFEPRLFGSVLCHYAEITLVANDYE